MKRSLDRAMTFQPLKIKQLQLQKKQYKENGQTLHEVLVASSILAITISGFSSGIIRSNQITHKASLRQAAESVMTNDLEAVVKRRFYTFRCKQGPCKAATSNNDKNLMYYDASDSDDKDDFIESCNARSLAKDLLAEDINDVTTGDETLDSSSLLDSDISINRTIALDESNSNQAIIEYEAKKDSDVIATIKTTLVPNAVHWCS
jgi:Tfp pilus assembly protein PilV